MKPLASLMVMLLLVALAHGPGEAGYEADCLSQDNARVISGCTIAIESGKWSGSGLKWAYISRGIAYYRTGEYDRAIADFSESLKLDPEDAYARNLRGAAHNESGQYKRAIPDLDEAIRLNANYADAYHNRGIAYGELGDYDRAITEFNEALRLEPENFGALYSRGWAHYKKGDYNLTIADLTEVIRLDPKTAVNYNLRGAAYYATSRYDKAIADYTEAMGLDANYEPARSNRAEAHIAKGEYDRAFEDVNEGIRIDPGSGFAFRMRGHIHKAKGRLDLAAEDYRTAVRLEPENAEYKKDLDEVSRLLAQETEPAAVETQPEPAEEEIALAHRMAPAETPDEETKPAPAEPAAQAPETTPPAGRGAFTVRLSGRDAPVELYGKSFALVIGIDDYSDGWPRLSNAIKDARTVAAELERRGFEVELVIDPDSAGLRTAMERFIFEKGSDPEARLFIWFAGHGHTVKGEGYLVPSGAPGPDTGWRFRKAALSLRSFGRYMREVESRHVLAVFDSCFAGTIFNTARSRPPAAIDLATTQPVRQFVSSGEAEQVVSDDGTFARLFIDALNGLEPTADANRDGYVTGTEIGLFLSDKVTNLTDGAQTPRYGKLKALELDRGDFVFAIERRERLAKPDARPAAETKAPPQIDREALFWSSIKDSDDVALFEAFLEQFPDGMFAVLAKHRIRQLGK